MPAPTNLRTAKFSTSSGKDVKDTSQLKGEASNSLSGTNSTTQFEKSGSGSPGGKMGGMPSGQ